MTTEKLQITDCAEVFKALENWIKQRPNLDPRDYGFDANGQKAFTDEGKAVVKDRRRALKALQVARDLQPAKPELLADSFRAFSGRLEWEPAHTKTHHNSETGDTRQVHYAGRLTYTTGQYWPTEYRKAAASVLESYIAQWRQWYASEYPTEFTYSDMSDVIEANKKIGNHWFDKSSMEFFRTRICSRLIAGKRFITSECGPSGETRYTIREAQPDGTIDTIGDFQRFATLALAKASVAMERA